MNTATPRWTVRPEGSTWGDFGPDDQLGRLNLVTREKVLQGIAEVKEGISFCLSLPLTLPGGTALNPRRQPPKLRPIGRDGYPAMNFPTSLENPKYTDLICDDMIEFTMQYSTQWDSLAHVGQFFDVDGDGKPERVYYNGFRAGVDVVGPYDFEAGTELPEGATPAQVIEASSVIEEAGFTIIDDLLHGYGGGYLPPVLGCKSRPAGPVPEAPFRAGQTVVIQPNVVTLDGKAGVQSGEMVVITETGIERLHSLPRVFEVL